MKKLFILLAGLALVLVPGCQEAYAQQQNLREATAAEVSAGTIGLPAVITPRRMTGGGGLVTAEQFGGLPDTILTANVSTTSGSPIITCATANFTAADVGKLAILNEDLTNSTAGTLITGISNVLSATSITLSNAAVLTRSIDSLHYGVNCAPALQAAFNFVFAFNATAQIVQIGYGEHLCAGPTVANGFFEYSMVHVPATDGENDGEPIKTISLRGMAKAPVGTSGYFNYPCVTNGSTLYFVGPTNAADVALGQTCFIGGNYASMGYTALTMDVRNLIFKTTENPGLTALNFAYGGTVKTTDCLFTSDKPAGHVADHPQTNTYAYGILFPRHSNNGDSSMYDTDIEGFGTGFFATEHLSVYGGKVGENVFGMHIDNQTTTLHGLQLVANRYNMDVAQTGDAGIDGDGIWFEGTTTGAGTIADINDLAGYLHMDASGTCLPPTDTLNNFLRDFISYKNVGYDNNPTMVNNGGETQKQINQYMVNMLTPTYYNGNNANLGTNVIMYFGSAAPVAGSVFSSPFITYDSRFGSGLMLGTYANGMTVVANNNTYLMGVNQFANQALFTGDINAYGLVLNGFIATPTNATPANTTTPKFWINWTNSNNGLTYKVPLYQ